MIQRLREHVREFEANCFNTDGDAIYCCEAGCPAVEEGARTEGAGSGAPGVHGRELRG